MGKTISVIIPNFNGRNLLLKNLPNTIKYCQGCEIIVVDDASTDDSIKILKKNFKKLKVVKHSKNLGFARAVNSGIRVAKGDLVLLLNSDVSPRENFLDEARKHFTSDESLFAVALADYSHEKEKVVVRGKGKGEFRRGFLNHSKADNSQGETLWVSGGSGLFDKEKLIEIGLFDVAFAPFYWEDIDLSYRARKKGYHCIFEPNSKVDHFHEEGAIKKTKSKKSVKIASYKNQFLFVWKNITDPGMLLNHAVWFPFHFTNSALKGDWAFFAGFFWALKKMPKIIVNFDRTHLNDKISDKEVLKQFEKQ